MISREDTTVDVHMEDTTVDVHMEDTTASVQQGDTTVSVRRKSINDAQSSHPEHKTGLKPG